MSRQFLLYLTPGDFEELERQLRSSVDIRVFADESNQKYPLELSNLKIDKMGEENLTVYLTSEEGENMLCLEKLTDRSLWAVDVMFSSAVELSRCFFDGQILRGGRMYYTSGYYMHDGAWKEKDSKFLRWARAVFSITKKRLQRNSSLDAYFGHEAAELYRNHSIRLASP